MSDWNIQKFPVVSEKGTEYLVDISDKIEHGYVCASVYLPDKGWFGRKKFKHVSGGIFSGRYELKEWEYDFVAIAKHAVKLHENKLAKELLHRENKAKGAAKFAKWDGVIND